MDESIMATLFERSATPMVLVDDERRYRACNAAACEALAVTEEELLTLRLDDLTPADRLPGLEERWRRFMEMEALSGDSAFATRDGRIVQAHHSSTPNVMPGLHFLVFVPDGDGPTLDDITEEEQGGAVQGQSRSLTPREREVMSLLARGYTGVEIAERLFISPETVRIHVRNARGRLGARTRAQAIALAIRSGLIQFALAGTLASLA